MAKQGWPTSQKLGYRMREAYGEQEYDTAYASSIWKLEIIYGGSEAKIQLHVCKFSKKITVGMKRYRSYGVKIISVVKCLIIRVRNALDTI